MQLAEGCLSMSKEQNSTLVEDGSDPGDDCCGYTTGARSEPGAGSSEASGTGGTRDGTDPGDDLSCAVLAPPEAASPAKERSGPRLTLLSKIQPNYWSPPPILQDMHPSSQPQQPDRPGRNAGPNRNASPSPSPSTPSPSMPNTSAPIGTSGGAQSGVARLGSGAGAGGGALPLPSLQPSSGSLPQEQAQAPGTVRATSRPRRKPALPSQSTAAIVIPAAAAAPADSLLPESAALPDVPSRCHSLPAHFSPLLASPVTPVFPRISRGPSVRFVESSVSSPSPATLSCDSPTSTAAGALSPACAPPLSPSSILPGIIANTCGGHDPWDMQEHQGQALEASADASISGRAASLGPNSAVAWQHGGGGGGGAVERPMTTHSAQRPMTTMHGQRSRLQAQLGAWQRSQKRLLSGAVPAALAESEGDAGDSPCGTCTASFTETPNGLTPSASAFGSEEPSCEFSPLRPSPLASPLAGPGLADSGAACGGARALPPVPLRRLLAAWQGRASRSEPQAFLGHAYFSSSFAAQPGSSDAPPPPPASEASEAGDGVCDEGQGGVWFGAAPKEADVDSSALAERRAAAGGGGAFQSAAKWSVSGSALGPASPTRHATNPCQDGGKDAGARAVGQRQGATCKPSELPSPHGRSRVITGRAMSGSQLPIGEMSPVFGTALVLPSPAAGRQAALRFAAEPAGASSSLMHLAVASSPASPGPRGLTNAAGNGDGRTSREPQQPLPQTRKPSYSRASLDSCLAVGPSISMSPLPRINGATSTLDGGAGTGSLSGSRSSGSQLQIVGSAAQLAETQLSQLLQPPVRRGLAASHVRFLVGRESRVGE
ncbi:hypothetical protein HYH03_006488 [Edaphochlamys debaryana]|uniref:Uncharacterized protein n=1 Tax=Edaphochlamys debaryana TaxID=47281 RepID=A0A835YAW9_9CHLO|nr:hypothetical protein HYH03_006488 [Edaphochlamys debaryana]|eukprot:KAG2495545.1 hypothetical protein HYH03_006488 [Edaphochlamys debaryana]